MKKHFGKRTLCAVLITAQLFQMNAYATEITPSVEQTTEDSQEESNESETESSESEKTSELSTESTQDIQTEETAPSETTEMETETEQEQQSLKVTVASQDVYCTVGDIATIQVSCDTENVTYRWYYSKDSGMTWNGCQYSGYRTDTLTFTCKNYQYGYMFRCKITDSNGNSIESDAITLHQTLIAIQTQPQDNSAMVGENAAFTTEAIGYNLSYRWYYSKDNGTTWNPCQYAGCKTNTLDFTVSAYQYGYCFKCKVTDKNGNSVETDSVTLNYPTLTIETQPTSVSCCFGEDAVFTIVTTGYKQHYTWYYSKDEGETWSLSPFSGRRTSTMTVSNVTEKYDGYQFYCQIENYDGTVIESEKVALAATEQESLVTLVWEDEENSVLTEEYDVLYTAEDDLKNAVVTEDSEVSVSFAVDSELSGSDVALVHFIAYAKETCGKIKVEVIGSKSFQGTYVLSTDKTEYIFSISGFTEISDVKITLVTDTQGLYLNHFEILNCGEAEVGYLKTGLYDIDDNSENVVLDEESAFSSVNATDIVSDGNYLYAVYRGELSVYSLENAGSPEKVGTLSGLGNSRDIAFCHNGKGLAITARENGVYFVDISNPFRPVLCSNLDSLELATGVTCAGDYAFVCSRHFGVEIYDITDLSNPTYCTQVSEAEEYYDCCVDGEYLYVSVWGQKKIRVYSLADVYNPVEVAAVSLSGAGGGCDVEDGYLYVAIGYNTTDERKTITSPGYGYGDGLEIYDVTDPTNPQWVSGTRIDGRYYYSGFDHWRVTVENGYAYLAHTYNGAFVYDVTEPTTPKRVEKITVNIPTTSSKYKEASLGSYVLSYNPKEYAQAIVTDVVVGNGYLYLGTDGLGIFAHELGTAAHQSEDEVTLNGSVRQSSGNAISVTGYDARTITCDGTVYSIVENNGYYFCAAGTAGVLVYDTDMNLVTELKTAGAAKDIKVCGGYLYTAESDQGLGVYSFDGQNLTAVSRCTYNYYNAMFSYISILPDEKHLCIQAGWTTCVFVDITDPTNPFLSKTIGVSTKYKAESMSTMYYRNMIVGLLGDKYVGVFDRKNITLYTNDDTGNVVKALQVSDSVYSEAGGITAIGDKALAIYKNGYVLFDYDTLSNQTLSSCTVHKISGASTLQGKPATDGNILVVSYNPGNQVTIADISDIENPQLLGQFTVDGNPDIAYVSSDRILIPLRHGGVLELKANS